MPLTNPGSDSHPLAERISAGRFRDRANPGLTKALEAPAWSQYNLFLWVVSVARDWIDLVGMPDRSP
jgi:hypothetical protein